MNIIFHNIICTTLYLKIYLQYKIKKNKIGRYLIKLQRGSHILVKLHTNLIMGKRFIKSKQKIVSVKLSKNYFYFNCFNNYSCIHLIQNFNEFGCYVQNMRTLL